MFTEEEAECLSTMIDVPFMAILPRPAQPGVEIVIKGRIKDDAEKFSVNLRLDYISDPQNIAYQFETNFMNEQSQKYKKNGNWISVTNDNISSIQGPGREFDIMFHFDQRELFVYSDSNFLYKFDHQFDIGHIKAVQIYDGLDYVTEIIYRYKQPRSLT